MMGFLAIIIGACFGVAMGVKIMRSMWNYTGEGYWDAPPTERKDMMEKKKTEMVQNFALIKFLIKGGVLINLILLIDFAYGYFSKVASANL